MTCVSMTAPTDPQIDPPVDRYAAERRRLKAMSKPFLDDEFMEGPPRYRGSDYRQPRLRRSTFDPKTLVFESRLGGGDDGFVWKVRFGGEGPFAMKVVSDYSSQCSPAHTNDASSTVLGPGASPGGWILLPDAARVSKCCCSPDDGGGRGQRTSFGLHTSLWKSGRQ